MTSLFDTRQPTGLLADPREAWLKKILDPGVVSRDPLVPMVEVGGDDTGRGSFEFGAPQFIVDMLKSGMLMGAAAQGYQPTEAEVTQAAMDMMLGGGFLSGMAKPVRGALGANMWHGGPHKWAPEPGRPAGRPRLDKMGTGEGAQAYGHGFYSAEARNVGETYQRVIGGDGGWATDTNPAFAQLGQSEVTKLPDDIAGRLNAAWHNRGPDSAKAMARKFFEESRGTSYSDTLHKLAFDADWSPTGTLYKLDIPDKDLAKYLDWDAPLSEQTQAVQDIAKRFGIKTTPSGMKEARGSDIYRAISQAKAEPPFNSASRNPGNVEGSEALRKAGIPGLKYYDQMSRYKTKAQVLINGVRDDTGAGGWVLRQNESDPQKALKGAIKEIESYGAPSGSARAADLETLKRWDKSPELVGISNPRTRNYVTWDQDVLDRSKILERNNQPLSNPTLTAKFLKEGGASVLKSKNPHDRADELVKMLRQAVPEAEVSVSKSSTPMGKSAYIKFGFGESGKRHYAHNEIRVSDHDVGALRYHDYSNHIDVKSDFDVADILKKARERVDAVKLKNQNPSAILANQLKDKGLLMGGNPLAAPLLMPSNTDPLSDPQRAAEFLRSGGV
jgi:hypothetical protein